MATEKDESSALLEQLGGCGRFQVLACFFIALPKLSLSLSFIFMAFGTYNPGFRCMNKLTSTTYSYNSTMDIIGTFDPHELQNNGTHSADDFSISCSEPCRHIEFRPEASTIVTEWALVCDRKWIISTIILVQMAGVPLAGFATGYLGDTFGRKFIIYLSLFINSVVNFISIFSVSWEMFAVCRFILSITSTIISSLMNNYLNELVPPKWRMVVSSLPMWVVGSIILSLTALVFKDWKAMHIFNGVLGFICCLPAFYLPESLRWLTTKGKEKQTLNVVRKIAKVNKAALPSNLDNCFLTDATEKSDRKKACLSVVLLFRKTTRLHAVVLAVEAFCYGAIYYSAAYGVSALPGNVYTNLIIVTATELPGNLICWYIPNKVGRKLSAFAFCSLQALMLFLVVAFEFVLSGYSREIGTLIVIIWAKIFMVVVYCILVVYPNEIFPTVIRSTASGFVQLWFGFGSMSASFLTPKDPSDLYISYAIMATLSVICAILTLLLPETLGKKLQDTFEPEENNEERLYENLTDEE